MPVAFFTADYRDHPDLTERIGTGAAIIHGSGLKNRRIFLCATSRFFPFDRGVVDSRTDSLAGLTRMIRVIRGSPRPDLRSVFAVSAGSRVCVIVHSEVRGTGTVFPAKR